jgi:hypothetical protein
MMHGAFFVPLCIFYLLHCYIEATYSSYLKLNTQVTYSSYLYQLPIAGTYSSCCAVRVLHGSWRVLRWPS